VTSPSPVTLLLSMQSSTARLPMVRCCFARRDPSLSRRAIGLRGARASVEERHSRLGLLLVVPSERLAGARPHARSSRKRACAPCPHRTARCRPAFPVVRGVSCPDGPLDVGGRCRAPFGVTSWWHSRGSRRACASRSGRRARRRCGAPRSRPARRFRLARPSGRPRVSRGRWVRWRESAARAGGREALPTPTQSPRGARDRGTRVSPRWGRLRRVRPESRSLEDLRGAVAALEAHLVGSRGPVGAVVEVDEEVGVDLHAAVGCAVNSQ
jgi:hypothetical protein